MKQVTKTAREDARPTVPRPCREVRAELVLGAPKAGLRVNPT